MAENPLPVYNRVLDSCLKLRAAMDGLKEAGGFTGLRAAGIRAVSITKLGQALEELYDEIERELIASGHALPASAPAEPPSRVASRRSRREKIWEVLGTGPALVEMRDGRVLRIEQGRNSLRPLANENDEHYLSFYEPTGGTIFIPLDEVVRVRPEN